MDNEKRKKLKEQYATRRVIGGIYAVRNTQNGKLLLFSTTDMPGSLNRFTFSQQIGGCIHPKLRKEWGKNGSGFVFEVLEELEKKEGQTDEEFTLDVQALFELTLEGYDASSLY
jgi:hypothetical protein